MVTYKELFKEEPSAHILGECYIDSMLKHRMTTLQNAGSMLILALFFGLFPFLVDDPKKIAWSSIAFLLLAWYYKRDAKEIEDKLEKQKKYLGIGCAVEE